MGNVVTTLTERGQISMPASLRKQLQVKPGQSLAWERVSDDECRVRVLRDSKPIGVRNMVGFMKRFHKEKGTPKTTAQWMKLLREGEDS